MSVYPISLECISWQAHTHRRTLPGVILHLSCKVTIPLLNIPYLFSDR